MNTLDLIIARTGLSITIEKMRNSADEIKQKNPTRVDLISSLEKSISDLTLSYVFFCELEYEYRISRQRNSDFEFDKMNDLSELIELRKINTTLTDGLPPCINCGAK